MNEFKLYWRYVQVHFLAELSYKGWPIAILWTMFHVVTDPIDAVLMIDRFGGVGGMTGSQILLMYAMAVSAFGFAELFGRGFDYFPYIVRTGVFDRVLLRPRSLFVQVATLRFQLHRISRALGMGIFAVILICGQGVVFGAAEVLLFVSALMGGMLVYTGIFLVSSAVVLFTIEPLDWIYVFTNGSYQVAKVPPKMLPDWLRRTFTYFVPMFVFCYYPAASICGWGEPEWAGWLALPVGFAFLGLGAILWGFGVKHYKSTGS